MMYSINKERPDHFKEAEIIISIEINNKYIDVPITKADIENKDAFYDRIISPMYKALKERSGE